MLTGRRSTAWAALAALLLLPLAAGAEEDSDWMNRMEDRMRVLEDELSASQNTIEAQREIIRLNPTEDVSQGSGLDEFFNGLEWGGFIQTTFTENFGNDPDAGQGTGVAQTLCQFNCDHDSFELPAVKLELGKAADEPGTAGFQLDLLWGENAGILGGFTGTAGDASDNWSHVQEAYVSYNYNGTEIKAGKFETLLGWEVIDAPYNYNITHGILFTFAIPLTHTGLLASGSVNEQVGWAAGITNGFNNVTDTNNNKGVLGQVNYDNGDGFFSSLSAYYGSDGPTGAGLGVTIPTSLTTSNNKQALILALVASLEPQEGTTLWANAD